MREIASSRQGFTGDPSFALAARTADYLLGCQVVAADAWLHLEPDPLDERRRIAELVTRELGADRTARRYRLIVEPGSPPRLWVETADAGLDDRAMATQERGPTHGRAGPFVEGDYFRLLGGTDLHRSDPTTSSERERHYERRLLSKYVRLLAAELRSPHARRLSAIAEGIANLGHYYSARRKRLPGARRFESVRGITWRIDRLDDREIRLSCYDRGGIFDTLPNSEGALMPPQVMGTVYTDAYAAWTFAFLYLATGEVRWRAAAILALEFLDRVYDRYAVSMTPMTHADFKNAGLLETLILFRDEMPEELRQALEKRARDLREDLYLPTNVHALRHHWKAAQVTAGAARIPDAIFARIHRRVRRDLLSDGLIQDNNPGRFYFDSHDLTYHHYTLACLASSLALRDDTALATTFLAGVDFSLACLTPDGEISYMGRGANNIYHLAAAVAAFRFAAGLVGKRETSRSRAATYDRAADLILPYLARAQRPDGMLATAINPEIELRMAWNHCHTPYNALTAYFLLRAAGLRAGGAARSDRTRPVASRLQPAASPLASEGIMAPTVATASPTIPMERLGRFDLLLPSGFAFIVTPGYYCTLFAGAGRSYSWTGVAHHYTGAPGIAMLGIAGGGALLPILDGPMTEYPFLADDPCGRARMTAASTHPPAVRLEREIRRHYVFLDDAIVVITRGRRLEWLLQVPVRRDGVWRSYCGFGTSTPYGGFGTPTADRDQPGALPSLTSTDGKVGVTWQPLSCTRSVTGESRAVTLSNPRGFAELHKMGRIEPRGGGSSGVLTVVAILPWRKHPRSPAMAIESTAGGVTVITRTHRIVETPGGLQVTLRSAATLR